MRRSSIWHHQAVVGETALRWSYDEPRPGTPRQIGDEQVEQVNIRTLETTPRGATQWSVRDMAKASGLSR